MSSSIFNTELIKIARHNLRKSGFVDPQTASADPAAAGGDPMAAAGADPMAGAMPPMPPMGGADPAAGGAPPPAGGDPMAGGDPLAGLQPMIEQAVSAAMAAGGGGAGGGAGGPGGDKMKVDVNTEIYHIKSLLTRMASELGIKVDPQMLQGDPAMDPAIPQEQAAQDPNSAAAQQSAIGGIDPIQGASPAMAMGGAGGGAPEPKVASWENGHSFDSANLTHNNDRASALATQLRNSGVGRRLPAHAS